MTLITTVVIVYSNKHRFGCSSVKKFISLLAGVESSPSDIVDSTSKKKKKKKMFESVSITWPHLAMSILNGKMKITFLSIAMM